MVRVQFLKTSPNSNVPYIKGIKGSIRFILDLADNQNS
jgi:hypothetical protein